MLKMCQKRLVTVKRAFSMIGVLSFKDGRKPFKQHTEEAVFACIMNWIINQMNRQESVFVRYKVEQMTYQMKFYYSHGHLLVTVPKVVATNRNKCTST